MINVLLTHISEDTNGKSPEKNSCKKGENDSQKSSKQGGKDNCSSKQGCGEKDSRQESNNKSKRGCYKNSRAKKAKQEIFNEDENRAMALVDVVMSVDQVAKGLPQCGKCP